MKRHDLLTSLVRPGPGLSSAFGGVVGAEGGGTSWRGIKTDHYDGRYFFNPRGPTGATFANFIKWQRSRRVGTWPARVDNTIPLRLPGRVNEGEVFVTAVNHCTFLIQLSGLNLLTDPVYSERVSPFSFAGPRRIRPPGIPWAHLPRIDAVLVSHNHFDHLDLTTLVELYRRFQPKFITGYGNREILSSRGIRDVEELDWWQSSTATTLAARVVFTPAQHWSSRSLIVKNTTLWGGFWIENDRSRIYFAGDSGYGPDFAAIRLRLGVPDLALLPIGAYEPRWFMSGSHLAPDDALRARRDLGEPRCLAMHFDTFALADEAFGAAERELEIARTEAGLPDRQFHAPSAGETALVA